MNTINLKTPSSYQEQASTLYFLLGKTVWAIQHLEDALNMIIIMKQSEAYTKIKADDILKSYRKLPLGRAIERAKQEKTFDEKTQQRLQDFLQERNWLIHRCMHESVDEVGYIIEPEKLFKRIESIHLSAFSLKEKIEINMLEFVKSKGRGDIVETVRKSYIEWIKNHSKTPIETD